MPEFTLNIFELIYFGMAAIYTHEAVEKLRRNWMAGYPNYQMFLFELFQAFIWPIPMALSIANVIAVSRRVK